MIITLKKGSETIEVEVNPEAQIGSLQTLIKSKFRIATSLQKLSLQDDIQLALNKSFSSYNISPRAVIFIESVVSKSFISGSLSIPSLTSGSFIIPSNKNSPLDTVIVCIKSGNLQGLKDIITNFASPQVGSMKQEQLLEVLNGSDELHWSPVHYSCFYSQHLILEILINYKCDLNSETIDHYFPLQIACQQNSIACVDLLIKSASIQINKMNGRGSALHIACKSGNARIAEKLLDAGAHPSLDDPNGLTPILMTENLEILELIPKYIGKALIDKYSHLQIDLPLSFSGHLFHSSPWKVNESQVFLLLDSTTGYLYHYNKRNDFECNLSPEFSIKIQMIEEVKTSEETIVETKYFVILKTKLESYHYYSRYDDVTAAWVQRINEAVQYFHIMDIKDAKPCPPVNGNVGERCVQENSHSISIENFTLLREVGIGSFGKVYEARKTESESTYALKVLCKSTLKRHNQLKYAIAECKILKEIRHPFIIPLHWAFQSDKNLYMVYEFCPYGDLSNILKKKTRLREIEARFYIAETILAIEYLHSLNIVYRDLKPLNVLVDSMGHVRLADFGLAKANVSKANPAMSFCGTPAYLAPELLKQAGAHKPVDIYSIGVTLYELITGVLPFHNENLTILYKAIASGKIQFPIRCSDLAKSLIRWLMSKDPEKRPTISQVKNHEFFEKVNWEGLLKRETISAFRPDFDVLETGTDGKMINDRTLELGSFDITMVEDKEVEI